MDRIIFVIAVIEAIVIVILLVYQMRRHKALTPVVKQAEEIKQRRMDLDDIQVKNKQDSQAALADAINVIKNNLLTFIEATKGNVVVLSDAISVLSKGALMNQDGSERISESLSIVVGKVEEQLSLVKTSLDLIEDNTVRLQEIDVSVKGIGQLLEDSVDSCKDGLTNLEKYGSNIEVISQNLGKSKDILADFSKKIDEINEIGAFIVDISESLKLLAFNASIEAARVGAAGSGFTVVAKEMGVMSEKTQEGIGTINQILDGIIDSSNQANECISECVESFEQSSKVFDTVNASFHTIDSQAGTMHEKMRDILIKIDSITLNSKLSREKANQAYEASEMITSGTQEIAQVSGETADTSAQISGNVDALDSMLSSIQMLLKQFATSVQPTTKKADHKVKIAFFSMLDNDFWYSIRRGAIYAKKELEEFGAQIDYVPFKEWSETEHFPEIVDKMIAEGYDGYIFPGFMAGQALEKLQEAVARGAKMMCFNCECPQELPRVACFQPDTWEAGTSAAKEMERALGKAGKVIILAGDLEVEVNKLRTDSFKKYLAKNKGIKVVDTVLVEEDEMDVYNKTMEILRQNSDIKGLYITVGMPVAAAKAIEDAGFVGKVSLVAFDHTDEIFKYIKKGIISAAIGQDPFGQGHDPIVWMYNNIVNNDKLPSENMKCRANVVDKSNVENLVEA